MWENAMQIQLSELSERRSSMATHNPCSIRVHYITRS